MDLETLQRDFFSYLAFKAGRSIDDLYQVAEFSANEHLTNEAIDLLGGWLADFTALRDRILHVLNVPNGPSVAWEVKPPGPLRPPRPNMAAVISEMLNQMENEGWSGDADSGSGEGTQHLSVEHEGGRGATSIGVETQDKTSPRLHDGQTNADEQQEEEEEDAAEATWIVSQGGAARATVPVRPPASSGGTASGGSAHSGFEMTGPPAVIRTTTATATGVGMGTPGRRPSSSSSSSSAMVVAGGRSPRGINSSSSISLVSPTRKGSSGTPVRNRAGSTSTDAGMGGGSGTSSVVSEGRPRLQVTAGAQSGGHPARTPLHGTSHSVHFQDSSSSSGNIAAMDDRPSSVLRLMTQLETAAGAGTGSWGDIMTSAASAGLTSGGGLGGVLGSPRGSGGGGAIGVNTASSRPPSSLSFPSTPTRAVRPGSATPSRGTTMRPGSAGLASLASSRAGGMLGSLSPVAFSSTRLMGLGGPAVAPVLMSVRDKLAMTSPERGGRPTPEATLARSEQRLAAAEANRDKLEEERKRRLAEKAERAREVAQRVANAAQAKTEAYTSKLEAAGQRHEDYLRAVKARAGTESLKVSEIGLTASKEAEEKRAGMQQRLQGAEGRAAAAREQIKARSGGQFSRVTGTVAQRKAAEAETAAALRQDIDRRLQEGAQRRAEYQQRQQQPSSSSGGAAATAPSQPSASAAVPPTRARMPTLSYAVAAGAAAGTAAAAQAVKPIAVAAVDAAEAVPAASMSCVPSSDAATIAAAAGKPTTAAAAPAAKPAKPATVPRLPLTTAGSISGSSEHPSAHAATSLFSALALPHTSSSSSSSATLAPSSSSSALPSTARWGGVHSGAAAATTASASGTNALAAGGATSGGSTGRSSPSSGVNRGRMLPNDIGGLTQLPLQQVQPTTVASAPASAFAAPGTARSAPGAQQPQSARSSASSSSSSSTAGGRNAGTPQRPATGAALFSRPPRPIRPATAIPSASSAGIVKPWQKKPKPATSEDDRLPSLVVASPMAHAGGGLNDLSGNIDSPSAGGGSAWEPVSRKRHGTSKESLNRGGGKAAAAPASYNVAAPRATSQQAPASLLQHIAADTLVSSAAVADQPPTAAVTTPPRRRLRVSIDTHLEGKGEAADDSKAETKVKDASKEAPPAKAAPSKVSVETAAAVAAVVVSPSTPNRIGAPRPSQQSSTVSSNIVASPSSLSQQAKTPSSVAGHTRTGSAGFAAAATNPLAAATNPLAASAAAGGGAAAAKARRKKLRKIRQYFAELAAEYAEANPHVSAAAPASSSAPTTTSGPLQKALAAFLKLAPNQAPEATASSAEEAAPAAPAAEGATSISSSVEAALQQLTKAVVVQQTGATTTQSMLQALTPILGAASVRIDYDRSGYALSLASSSSSVSSYGSSSGFVTQVTLGGDFGSDVSGSATASAVPIGDLTPVVRPWDGVAQAAVADSSVASPPPVVVDRGVAPLPVQRSSCDALRTSGAIRSLCGLLSREAAVTSPGPTGTVLRLLLLSCASPANREHLLSSTGSCHIADAVAGLLTEVAAMLVDRYGQHRSNNISSSKGKLAATAAAASSESSSSASTKCRWDDVQLRENVTGAVVAGLQLLWTLFRHCGSPRTTSERALSELALTLAHYAVVAGVPSGLSQLLTAYRLQDASAQVTGSPLAQMAFAVLTSLARLPLASLPAALATKPVYQPLPAWAASTGTTPPGCVEPLLPSVDETQAFDAVPSLISLVVAAVTSAPSASAATAKRPSDGGLSSPPRTPKSAQQQQQASYSYSTASSSEPPLPAGVMSTVLLGLQALNALAALDLPRLQRALGEAPGAAEQMRHALSAILGHCGPAAGLLAPPKASPTSFSSRSTASAIVAAEKHLSCLQALVVEEAVVLVGHYALGHASNRDSLHWGVSPTLLERLCRLPVRYFTDAAGKACLLPTLIAAGFGCDANKAVIGRELSGQMLVEFIREAQQKQGEGDDNSAARELRRRFPAELWEAAIQCFGGR